MNQTSPIQNYLPPYLSNTITVLKCFGCKQQCIYRIVSVSVRFVYLANDLAGGRSIDVISEVLGCLCTCLGGVDELLVIVIAMVYG